MTPGMTPDGPAGMAPDRASRLIGALRWAVVAMFAAVIAAGLFVPVYTDEIGWRFQERAALDGVDKMYSELCGPNTLARPPWFMWPARYYSAFFNTAFADPFWVRVSGIFYMLCWGALLLALFRKIGRNEATGSAATIVGFGLMCLGTAPFALVLSRPEQPIVLAATAALLLAVWDEPARPAASRDATAVQAWGRMGAITVLAAIAFSYHLKGVVLAPLFLTCLVLSARGRAAVIPRAVLAGLLVSLTAAAMAYWQFRLSCPDDAVLRAKYALNNTTATFSQVKDWDGVIAQLNFMWQHVTLVRYVFMAVPEAHPILKWPASGQLSYEASIQWFVAISAAWALAALFAVLSCTRSLYESVRERRLPVVLILAGMVFATVVVWSSMQRIRNFYEAGWMLPLSMLALVLAIASPWQEGRIVVRARNWFAVVLAAGALVSIIASVATWGPAFSRAARETGYTSIQPNSVSVFGYQRIRPQIEAAARLCRIPEPSRARVLLMDDVTYFYVMRSYLPQHHQGLLGVWTGELADPVAYLKARRSSGAIVSCERMPPAMRARARRVGDFCCLGPPDWGGL